LLPTLSLQIRAMIHLLLVRRRFEMCIQGPHGVEPSVAHIALPVGAVECEFVSRVLDVLFLVPFNLLVGDNAVQVTLANHADDGFAVKPCGAGAGTCLEVVGEAAGRGIINLAKRAGNVGAAVDL
jgi:hypothetical protein